MRICGLFADSNLKAPCFLAEHLSLTVLCVRGHMVQLVATQGKTAEAGTESITKNSCQTEDK